MPFAAEGFKVIAIEAGRKNCECLRRAATVNHFDIDVVEKAVWDKEGKIFFNEDGVSGFASEFAGSADNGDEVECICLNGLEKYVGVISGISMIKIDVEGAEIKTISGGKMFLQRMNYPPIHCESNKVTLLREGNRVTTLFEEMASVGYSPYILIRGQLQRVDVMDIQARTVQDYMFVHKDDCRLKKSKVFAPMSKEEKISILREELMTMPPEYVAAQNRSLEYYDDYRKIIEKMEDSRDI